MTYAKCVVPLLVFVLLVPGLAHTQEQPLERDETESTSSNKDPEYEEKKR